jgi:hypothetical protein
VAQVGLQCLILLPSQSAGMTDVALMGIFERFVGGGEALDRGRLVS